MTDIAWPSWISHPPTTDELITDDGEPLETIRHRIQMNILIESLQLAWQDRPDVFIGGNLFFYYSQLQTRRTEYRGPDVIVVLGAEPRPRKAWVMWEEESRRPDLIIELTSETTAEIDRGPKKRIYGSVIGVPYYVIYDPYSQELEGYQLTHLRAYQPLATNSAGRIPIAPFDLELGVLPGICQGEEAPWLRWFTPVGLLLPTGPELAARMLALAREETQRADTEARRAKTEARRAKTEARRAKAETERADAAEAELVRLRAELARYQHS